MLLYAATIFVSAFLLFLVQPIVAKQILPWFGGSAAVWTTCVFFFQFLLLAGYAYAHAITRWVPPRLQLTLHLALLSLGVRVAPVGLPYFLLSTTSPLVQAWYARRFDSPYRLFALSNLASLAALSPSPVAAVP